MVFHIRATSSPLSALVFMSQIVVYTIRPFHMYIENEVTGFPYVALKVLLVLCGIWSLDFFRSVIPPFCASSNIKTVHALALEYPPTLTFFVVDYQHVTIVQSTQPHSHMKTASPLCRQNNWQLEIEFMKFQVKINPQNFRK